MTEPYRRRASANLGISLKEKFTRDVDATIRTMALQGFALQCSYEKPHTRWWLSNGVVVPGDVAKAVILDPHVASVGDALFAETRSQTYRYATAKSHSQHAQKLKPDEGGRGVDGGERRDL
jgi:hypothetical protein